MGFLLPLSIFAFGVTATAAVTVRERGKARSIRRALFDRGASVFSGARITHALDGFPRLAAAWNDHNIRAELIPDTMTIRRLPQLWLSVTIEARLPVPADCAVLARPSGNDFYSLTERLPVPLSPPRSFPFEILVRGSAPSAQAIIDALEAPIASILRDPRVKEVAVTRKGLRIIRQASEGRRGAHLLLRQAVFDDADVAPDEVLRLLGILDDLRKSVRPGLKLVAA